jgi:hypothetical protein
MKNRFHTRSRWQMTSACSCMTMPLMIVMALMTATLVGCGRGHGDRGAVHPAEGQVLLDKKPVAGALVVLYPRGLSDAKAVPSRAQTGPDGRFRVSTFGTADGAPEGEYSVTIVQYPLQQDSGGGWTSGANALPAKYASPKTTDLRLHIGEGKSELPTLVLASPKKPQGNRQAYNNYNFQSQ